MKNINIMKIKNEPLRADFNFIPDWNGFDMLLNFIKSNYISRVIENADGPDARRCPLEVNGKVLELIHYDIVGNYIIAPTNESEAILYDICNTLKAGFELDNNFK